MGSAHASLPDNMRCFAVMLYLHLTCVVWRQYSGLHISSTLSSASQRKWILGMSHHKQRKYVTWPHSDDRNHPATHTHTHTHPSHGDPSRCKHTHTHIPCLMSPFVTSCTASSRNNAGRMVCLSCMFKVKVHSSLIGTRNPGLTLYERSSRCFCVSRTPSPSFFSPVQTLVCSRNAS